MFLFSKSDPAPDFDHLMMLRTCDIVVLDQATTFLPHLKHFFLLFNENLESLSGISLFDWSYGCPFLNFFFVVVIDREASFDGYFGSDGLIQGNVEVEHFVLGSKIYLISLVLWHNQNFFGLTDLFEVILFFTRILFRKWPMDSYECSFCSFKEFDVKNQWSFRI